MEGRPWSERRSRETFAREPIARETAAHAPATPPRTGSTLLGQTLKVRRVNDGNAFFIAKILGFDQGFVHVEVQPGQYSATIGLQGGERLWLPVPQIREFAEIVETPPIPVPAPATAEESASAVESAEAVSVA